MNAYYQDEWATLYHGDCVDIARRLPESSIDMLLTDPPYGVNFQSGARQEKFDHIINDDGTYELVEVLRAILPAVKNRRHVYVFGLTSFGDLPVGGFAELIWDKGGMGMGDLNGPWSQTHEKIAFGCICRSKENKKDGNGNLSARLRHGSVLRVDRLNSRAVTKHPTEKPTLLLRQMIESSTVMGETVFDPFAGSGSTLVAASLEGRKSIGIELDERYCEVAAKRLSQQSLFHFEEAV